MTPEWLWDQTPFFSVTNQSDGQSNEPPQASKLQPYRIHMEFRHAQFQSGSLRLASTNSSIDSEISRFHEVMKERRLLGNWTWDEIVRKVMEPHTNQDTKDLGQWLQQMLPVAKS